MDRYDHKEIEPKWQAHWQKEGINQFDMDSKKPVHSFDTPPPFTSGTLHMGHVLNHSWIDFVARYKRMNGFNVLLPQGFDCHGLPTELKVEKKYKDAKKDPEQFRKYCIEFTNDCIRAMKGQFQKIGYSADWRFEYQTMSPEYIKLVQTTLLEFYSKGRVYRKEHPVHWCPKCRTALAKAELGYADVEGNLNHIKFKVEGAGEITIATTRPELAPACVAVLIHPDDPRYKGLAGKNAILPIFNRKVPIIADTAVEKEFGTGAVYVCTFGDEQDLAWQVKYSLPVIIAIDRAGKMTDAAGKYAGLKVAEAREKIITDLKAEGALVKQEKITHRINIHAERSDCQSPIELLPTYQWFIKLKDSTKDVVNAASKMRWTPDYMFSRVTQWAEFLDWDWVISRQRIFGTPIPFWFCNCGKTLAPRKEDLPIDTMKTKPPMRCPDCGGEFQGVREVCDCWVDSSVTPLQVSRWLTDKELFNKVYPLTIRPQGYEIIRTWFFYTTFRCLQLTGKAPFGEVMLNGMVLGENGRKMSKSLGNVVSPDEALEKYGADALRQWAAYSTPGSDVPFTWKDVEYGSKFNKKLFNAAKFAKLHLAGYTPKEVKLELTDQWMLSKLSALVEKVTSSLDGRMFINALTPIQQFVWHELCDNYIEEVKYRLYSESPKKESAQYTLYTVFDTVLKLLAPFTPHLSEELYHDLLSGQKKSIQHESWPTPGKKYAEAEALVEEMQQVIMHLRKYKSQQKLALNAELAKAEISSKKDLAKLADDIKNTMNIKSLGFTDENKGFDKITEETSARVH